MAGISVPDRLLPPLDVLRRAYPDGVPERDYRPLLAFLQTHMSERSLAIAVAALIDGDPAAVASDSAVLAARPVADLVDITRVRDRLEACGWGAVIDGFQARDVHARLSPVPQQPDHVIQALDVLGRAYPLGIPGTDYMPLLAALWRDCSQRGLANIVGAYTGRHYVCVCCDADRVTREVTRGDADRVRRLLLDHGWVPAEPVEDDWPALRDA